MHLTAFPHQSPVNPDRAGLKLSTSAIAPQCTYPARKASAILQPISCVRPLLMPISYSPMNFPVLPNMRWTCWAWRLLRRVQVTLRSVSINCIKSFIEQNLWDTSLDTGLIVHHIGLSARYINNLFEDEGTSLMRYVWKRRLENCRKDILNPVYAGHRLTDIAFRWGFNDAAHFSRAFKHQFGCPPREFRCIKNQPNL